MEAVAKYVAVFLFLSCHPRARARSPPSPNRGLHPAQHPRYPHFLSQYHNFNHAHPHGSPSASPQSCIYGNYLFSNGKYVMQCAPDGRWFPSPTTTARALIAFPILCVQVQQHHRSSNHSVYPKHRRERALIK